MNYLETVQGGASAFAQPFVDMFTAIAMFLPLLLAAFVVLIIGLIVSPMIGKAVTKGLELIKVDQLMDKLGAKDAMASIGIRFSLSKMSGVFIKYVVLIVFVTMVADILNLGELSRLIQDFVRFIPQMVIALIMIGVGLTIADWLRDLVVNIARASDNEDYAELLGNTTRISIIVFAVMAALVQVDVAASMVKIIFSGIVFALALAFGLGAKDTVARALDKWFSK